MRQGAFFHSSNRYLLIGLSGSNACRLKEKIVQNKKTISLKRTIKKIRLIAIFLLLNTYFNNIIFSRLIEIIGGNLISFFLYVKS